MASRVLEVQDLVTRFYTNEGVVHAVNGVSFHLDEGETLGLVGESGCGKSVTMLSLLRLIPEPPGKIERGEAIFKGNDLLKLSAEEMRQIRGGQIAMIFQDPMTSLNPSLSICKQITEALREHEEIPESDARRRAIELLQLVGIPNAERRVDEYPHQFSGGMRQRVMIAIALSCEPNILIADEPTTALDVTIQAQIVDLVKRLRDELGMSVIWITHDLGVVAGLVKRVSVMYSGFIVERAPVRDLYKNPRHPYTISLLASLPRIDGRHAVRLANIEGQPPNLLKEPQFCPFAPRCGVVVERCWEENPTLRPLDVGQQVACWVDIGRDEYKSKMGANSVE
ncbi:MAG: ABC transporter ATP-binding protein [Anaerolineales bacterium]